MKKSFCIIAAIAFLAIFVGCATLSKNECLQADWLELGRKDGSLGQPRSLFQNHYEACLDHNVNADSEAYYSGREEGLKSYCTEQSGFEQGSAGNSYKHVCPAALEPDFLAGYEKGRELYQYEAKVASLQRQLKNIERKINLKEKKTALFCECK